MIFNRRRFLEDYVVVKELNAAGKTVKKSYYQAEYYETDWDDRQVKTFKLTALGLSVLSAAGSVFPLSVYCDAMSTMYVIMAFVLGMIMGILMLVSAFELPKTAAPMERSTKYYGFDKLRIRSLIACFCGLYGALINAAFCWIIFPRYAAEGLLFSGNDVLVSVSGLVTAGAAFLCFRKLKSANVRRSEKESEWRRYRREVEEKEGAEQEPEEETGA